MTEGRETLSDRMRNQSWGVWISILAVVAGLSGLCWSEGVRMHNKARLTGYMTADVQLPCTKGTC